MAHATHDMMKAVAIDRFGGLDELRLHDIPRPKPAADEVLVRVRAAGVGIWDSLQRRGEMAPDEPKFPLVLGAECAGDVEECGSSVASLREGEAVYAYFWGVQGAYAQYVAIKADYVARKPLSLSYIEAAGAPTDGITAHQALFDSLKIQPDEWLFIAGGAGGVGSLAVQLAINAGSRVIASAAGSDFEILESYGVPREQLIDYAQSDVPAAVREITGGAGAHAALDAVGGPNSNVTLQAVRDGGRLAELTGQELEATRDVNIFHIESEPSAKRLDLLGELFDSGKIKMRIAGTFSLAHAREAQEIVENHHAHGKTMLEMRGKIVLTVD